MKFNSFPALLSIATVLFVVVFMGGLYTQSAVSAGLPLVVINLVAKDDTAPTIQPWSYNGTNPILEVKVGTKVRLNLDNTNAFAVHDFVIEEGMGVHLAPDLFPSQKGSVEFFVGTPGEFTYFCSVPNHRVWGMEGTFIAVP